MKSERLKYGDWRAWATLGVLCLTCFAFFQWAYPYHLHHREQVMLYQGASDLWAFGGVGCWLSQWLTQYFYYRVAGPLIVTVVLAAVWVGAWLLTLRITGRQWIAMGTASVMMLWQALCQTSHLSTLQPALAWGLILLALGALWGRWLAAMPCALAALWLMGNPFGGSLWSWPDMQQERRMAFDCEAYFGNWDAVLSLAEANTTEPTEVYYYNLAQAVNGTLPDGLLRHKQIGTEGLLPSLGPQSDYLMMNALGEVWYRIGALTDAEHCAMLGLVFSPNSTGSRYVRRLAEVNQANGEEAAARKYLGMLLSSGPHAQWARQRLESPTDQTLALRALQPPSDTLHMANDIVMILRHMLDTPGDANASAPANKMAYDYLLCLHLINRNLEGFLSDYRPEMPRSRLYDEALILALLQKGATPQEAMGYGIDPEVMRHFQRYRDTKQPSADEFGTTYWYYYNYL